MKSKGSTNIYSADERETEHSYYKRCEIVY